MAIGIVLGKAFPGLAVALDAMELDTVSLPIAMVGPLVEVPVLIGLVYISLWLGRQLYPDDALWASSTAPAPATRNSSGARRPS